MQYNKERILSRLMEMIQIDSVSYKEGPMTDYLQKYFEDRGYEVYRDQAGKAVGGDHSGNLLIHIPGTMEGESICLNAHQDTVEPGIGIVPVLEDGKLKSSGDTILAPTIIRNRHHAGAFGGTEGNRNPPSGHVLSFHHL